MEHNDIRHMLSEYIDGAVSDGEKTEIEAHLKSCRQCTDALEELRKTIEHVKQVEAVEPPAWMTQKIMARVREEAETKRSLFQRLFTPLAVKLPLEAAGVLFLAVTAFYVYRSTQPEVNYPAPPMKQSETAKEAQPIVAQNNLKKNSEEHVPQKPGYKALDMKPEYEKPAPALKPEQPVPAEREASNEKRAFAPQAAASSRAEGQAAGTAALGRTDQLSAASAQRAVKKAETAKTGPVIILQVKNIESAAKELEQTITRLGGSMTKRENHEEKKVYTVAIDAQKLSELKNKLKLVGNVKDEAEAVVPQGNRVELTIELVEDPAR